MSANGAEDDIAFYDVERFTILGGLGDDHLTTGEGDDVLEGNAGHDILSSAGGDDVLSGGAGNDTLIGGAGDDIFTFVAAQTSGNDIITDFQRGSGPGDGDKINVASYGISSSQILFETEAGGLLVRLGSDTILLQGITLAALDESDFIGLVVNQGPTASPIDAGTVLEMAGVVSVDLLVDAGAADSDGGTLGVANVMVTDGSGNPVLFGLSGSLLTIDPAQFAPTLDAGQSATLTISYTVTDGQGGATPNTGQLVVDGVDGPFTWYIDNDADGFGVDDQATNQTAYTAPAGTSDVAGDADDADLTFYPGAPEINDGKDNDQDGSIDEDNAAPVSDAEALEVAEDGTLVIAVATLLDGDIDPDGDTLIFTGVSNPVNGTVAIDDKGDGDPFNDEVMFTPAPGFSGGASFDYAWQTNSVARPPPPSRLTSRM